MQVVFFSVYHIHYIFQSFQQDFQHSWYLIMVNKSYNR
jgi:hypothetical protein